ncbi:MAG TPA: saccharopine dehydrogenase NADP-binding domain-containing protein [Chryseolinea sp.]|nr:saccharopine dehydrogenase NADP-binding domain-containing protein [Chryseolinea sp.]HPM30872.1 saccharopine dehydrogenase NADP-binding domain-containing protein [Chryseolinea sp.]
MNQSQVVLYGSYGYTGKLIAQECKSKNINIVLAGRNQEALILQSKETGFPYEVVDLNNHDALLKLLTDRKLVIHCGGPFQFTSKQMVDACLETKTHYTDISGEFTAFEMLATYDSKAKAEGIMILPGIGFDVVPSDCLALHLKKQLPSATHLQLAFTTLKGGLSRGTARTTIEGLGYGSYVRVNGKLKPIPLASRSMTVNFGDFTTSTLCIPWGDISTAYRSTNIPNIEVYMGMPEKTIQKLKWANYFNWLMRKKWVKTFLKNQIDKRPAGPSDDRRKNGRSFLWGRVWDDQGNTAISTLQTFDGYTLTAKTSVLIAEKIIFGNHKTGFQTPAMAYGENLILEIESSIRKDHYSG